MTSAPSAREVDLRFPVGGIELAVAEYPAAGPALILLHGIGSRGVSWWPVIDELAAHFHLIVPDLRGHGASAKPAAGYRLEDYAADLAALIDGLAIERPSIVGHSLGGHVALEWAVRHPNRAARLVLEDTPLRGSPQVAPLLDAWLALASLTVEEAAAHYKREHPGWSDEDCRRRAESITATAPAVFPEARDRAVAVDGEDRIAPLASLETPILLVHGDPEAGGMVDPRDAARFAATVANGRVTRIPGGSHALHRDHTEEFLAVVLPFLAVEG